MGRGRRARAGTMRPTRYGRTGIHGWWCLWAGSLGKKSTHLLTRRIHPPQTLTHAAHAQTPPPTGGPVAGSIPFAWVAHPSEVLWPIYREMDGIKASIKEGGAATERGFEKVAKEFSEVKKEIGETKTSVMELEKGMVGVNASLQTLKEQGGKVEGEVKEVRKDMEGLKASGIEVKGTVKWVGIGVGGVVTLIQLVLTFRLELAKFLESL